MIELNKEYFISPYYFFLTEKKDKISLYFNVAETLTESRKNDVKIDFDKRNSNKVRKDVKTILKGKKNKTKSQIKKYFDLYSKEKGEIDELIDMDGTLTHSNIPILDKGLTPRKTTDQTIVMARMTDNPVTRGYRKYYGESTEEDDVVSETNFSDAFGYDETKNLNGPKTFKTLKKMGVEPEEAVQRTKQFGKDPSGKRQKNAPKHIRNKKNFIDRMTLSEIERNKMIKMVEDILMKKRAQDTEMTEKESKISKILKKNILSLKKMAEKDGLTISQLIKMLKSE
jgi:hypothetical protein